MSLIGRRFYAQVTAKNDSLIMAASILHRNPIVMRPISEVEREYAKYRENLEAEKARGAFAIDKKADASSKSASVTGVQLPETVEVNNDLPINNLNRKLNRKLYFCFKGDDGKWTLPSAIYDQNGSDQKIALHSHLQNHLKENVFGPSEGLQLYHLGAAPVAFHHEKFADRVAPPLGAKVFFFRSQLVAGKVNLSPKYKEFGWLSKEEMKGKLDKDLFKSIEPVISE